MSTIPTIPTFTAGAPTLTQLNQLSYATSFICDADIRPTWHYIMFSGTQSLTANTWTPVAFDHAIYDNDGVLNAGVTHGAAIKTQGYYRVEACIDVQLTTTEDNPIFAFQWNAGGSSPYSSQSPLTFGYRGASTSVTGAAAGGNAFCLSDITPIPMYAGDALQVMAYYKASSGGTLDYNHNAAYNIGRFSTQFTGYWVREGS